MTHLELQNNQNLILDDESDYDNVQSLFEPNIDNTAQNRDLGEVVENPSYNGSRYKPKRRAKLGLGQSPNSRSRLSQYDA